MYHRTELVADLRDEPVPTTSPTYASGKPFFIASSICDLVPFSLSVTPLMPSRGCLSIARACNGISGRDQASGAGERSSVLVSPVTLNTVNVIFFATSGRDVNHSASAHDFMMRLAAALPFLALS